MSFLATTRVAVIRGTLKSPLGDEVDANEGSPVAGYEDLPASLIERERTVFDPSTGTPRTIPYVAGRLPANVKLRDGDRIKDNRTGTVYSITKATDVARALSGQSSLRVELTTTLSP